MILSIRNCVQLLRKQRSDHSALNTYEFTHVTEMWRLVWVPPDHQNHRNAFISLLNHFFISWLPFLRFQYLCWCSSHQVHVSDTKEKEERKEGKGTCQQYIPSLRGYSKSIVLSLSSAKSFCMPSILYKELKLLVFILTRTFLQSCCFCHRLLSNTQYPCRCEDMKAQYGFGRET